MHDTLELVQGTLLTGRITLTVSGNRDLSLSEKRLLRSTHVHFPLDQISPVPTFIREMPFGWIVISGVFIALTVVAFWGGFASRDAGAWFALILMTGISIGCIYNTWKLSRNLLMYKSAATGNHIFAISRNSPSPQQVDEFVQKLKERIESFRSPKGMSQEELLDLYKKHLQYLLNEGVLLPEEYSTIESRLAATSRRATVFEIVR